MHNTAFDNCFIDSTAIHPAPCQGTPCEWPLISIGVVIPGRVNSHKVRIFWMCISCRHTEVVTEAQIYQEIQPVLLSPRPHLHSAPRNLQLRGWLGLVRMEHSLRLEPQDWDAAYRVTWELNPVLLTVSRLNPTQFSWVLQGKGSPVSMSTYFLYPRSGLQCRQSRTTCSRKPHTYVRRRESWARRLG